MWTGVIHGSVTSTIKHPAMKNGKLLIVQPVNPISGSAEGNAQVVVDTLGAGLGQRVLVSSDGLGTQRMLGVDRGCPVRLAVVAILHEGSIHVQKRSQSQ